jgi:adenine specific DNA methylase Mod
VDKAERQNDIDDGADDWDGFDNNLSSRGIASCFMKRAKRAFWAGKTWKEFEIEERSLSSQTLRKDGVAEPHALDNALRGHQAATLRRDLAQALR